MHVIKRKGGIVQWRTMAILGFDLKLNIVKQIIKMLSEYHILFWS